MMNDHDAENTQKPETDPNIIKLARLTETLSNTDIFDSQKLKDCLNEIHIAIADLTKSKSKEMKFTVYVDDNYHFMKEEERYTLGVFDTEDEAIQAAKAIVDEFLASAYKPGVKPESLMETYVGLGEDPWITASPFNAWDYAKARCDEICSGIDDGGKKDGSLP